MILDYAMVFDAAVVLLLLATIVYAAVLNRKLSALRDAEAEMRKLVTSFGEAAAKAEQGVAAIRQTASECGEELRQRVEAASDLMERSRPLTEQAHGLTDDLAFMIEKGTAVADRLEAALASNRQRPQPATALDPAPLGATPDRSIEAAADGPAVAAAADGGKSRPRTPARASEGAAGGGRRSAGQSALIKALQGMR